MSRVGKQPIILPAGVTASVADDSLVVVGPRGTLKLALHPHVRMALADGTLTVNVLSPDDGHDRALWGLFRNLAQNLVTGVTQGFTKSLELVGVGYRVAVSGSAITLNIGFSHPVVIQLPEGITAKVDKNTLAIEGNDKQAVGEFAASIRRLRQPEPYKGKGIKYVDEIIRRKAGKAAKAVGK